MIYSPTVHVPVFAQSFAAVWKSFLESNDRLDVITNSITVLWKISNSNTGRVFQPFVDVFTTAYLYLPRPDIDYLTNDYLTDDYLTISHKE